MAWVDHHEDEDIVDTLLEISGKSEIEQIKVQLRGDQQQAQLGMEKLEELIVSTENPNHVEACLEYGLLLVNLLTEPINLRSCLLF